jgi:hypothetical protein
MAQPCLDHDFSRVRIHTGPLAAESARAVNAHAYTVGQDIVFAAGQYRPGTKAGDRLLAHELTHTVQQSGAKIEFPVRIGPVNDIYEQAAAAASLSRQAAFAPVTPIRLQRQDEAALTESSTATVAPGAATVGVPSLACPDVPATTPSTCSGRHDAYAAARRCFPLNSWLACVDRASADVCQAVDAFSFVGSEGFELRVCVALDPSGDPKMTRAKASWFDFTNACIWGHWRAAFDAVHLPFLPVPGTLTPEWASAVVICRKDGVGSGTCCRAHVVAEQSAIDRCGAYDSTLFGRLPTDVPHSALCSGIVLAATPPPAFTGDFGNLRDRISYGDLRCCTF